MELEQESRVLAADLGAGGTRVSVPILAAQTMFVVAGFVHSNLELKHKSNFKIL